MSTLNVSNLAGPSSTGTAAVLSSINGGPISGARNRIINGDMRIDQRNAGVSITPVSGQFSVDRWGCYLTQASKYSIQRTTTAPPGFDNAIIVSSASAYSVLSTDFFILGQAIEGFNVSDLAWGTTDAKPITVSFWVRSSLTGAFGGSITNNDNSRSYPFTFAISSANTYEYKTITIPGDTTGTWTKDNTAGMKLWFGLGVGVNGSATAGAWTSGTYYSASGVVSLVGTNGATFYITGVQLEPGTVATPFERRSYGQELALCQRYFETSYPAGSAVGSAIGSAGMGGVAINAADFYGGYNSTPFAVKKRATPTMAAWAMTTGTSGVWYSRTAAANQGNVGFRDVTDYGFNSLCANNALTATAASGANWTATAEL